MKQLLLVCLLTVSSWGFSQGKVEWNVSYNKTANQLEFKAGIAEGWHLYSQFIQNDIGPVPTTFVFSDTPAVKWDGNVAEPKPIHEYDENLGASLDFFKNEVIFTRKLKPGSKGTITGYVTYMICNDVKCLPPVDYNFSVTIP